ncbi:hypothetical protein DWB68_15770 [Galactobacter valiniphilus]|uniref:Uncharacterized protein n=1 Tax=Galactobacter valiniphilus TaxID=2676122 RepID=A0A399J6P5_9MICC|nr:hypothetical protein [Galactobacter valiniphilus]RII40850.1 hypothetical protein DWB68_15770 [Galactobacter valiniphilus]
MNRSTTVKLHPLASFVGLNVHIPYDEYAPDGLVAARRGHGNTWIIMGTETEPAPFTIEYLDVEPQTQDFDAWEDVAEFSFEDAEADGEGDIFLTDSAAIAPDDLIALNQAGHGWYRIRVHARDRGAAQEEYLVQAWPAPRAAPRTLKKTSAFADQAAAEYDTGSEFAS